MTEKKTVLIADDDRDLLAIISARCERLGLEVVTADEAMTALSCVDFIMPDLVILDVNMPAGNGLSVCEMMATDSRLRNIPVIIMTGRTDQATQRRCYEMAAYFVPKTENTWGRLKPLICQLLGLTAELPEITNGPDSGRSQIIEPLENSQGSESIDALFSALGWEPTVVDTTASDGPSPQSTPGPWVLTIDDDSDLSFSLKVRLAEHGVDVLRAFEGMEGFRYAFAGQAQAIILDYEMPDVNGDYVLRRLQENPVTRNIPVVVLTGHQDNALKRKMFNLGAAAFLTKPVRWEELWEELQKHITPPEIAMV